MSLLPSRLAKATCSGVAPGFLWPLWTLRLRLLSHSIQPRPPSLAVCDMAPPRVLARTAGPDVCWWRTTATIARPYLQWGRPVPSSHGGNGCRRGGARCHFASFWQIWCWKLKTRSVRMTCWVDIPTLWRQLLAVEDGLDIWMLFDIMTDPGGLCRRIFEVPIAESKEPCHCKGAWLLSSSYIQGPYWDIL